MIESIGKDELPLLLELNKINSFRSQFLKLRDAFNSFKELSSATLPRLASIEDMPSRSAKLLAEKLPKLDVGKEYEAVQKTAFQIVTCMDDIYPEQLLELPQPPPVLYIKGKLDFNYAKSISIVGSRSTSPYGISITNKLAYELAAGGFCIVSGGARGIDSAAHKSVLDAKGKTIAVMACGLDDLYPPENEKLFEQISENGAVISEFPLGTVPEKYNFPMRNRIIAGLTRATMVTQAGEKSGALITAEHALELGRDVFAVPGRPTDMGSRGANKLIRDGAFVVIAISDIFERFGLTLAERKSSARAVDIDSLSADEKLVYEAVDFSPVLVDELSRRLDKNVSELLEPLVSLQLKGLIKEMPGKSFVRTV
jgi:DNA processing protein